MHHTPPPPKATLSFIHFVILTAALMISLDMHADTQVLL